MGRGRSDTCKRGMSGWGQPRVRPKRLCGGGRSSRRGSPAQLWSGSGISPASLLPHCARLSFVTAGPSVFPPVCISRASLACRGHEGFAEGQNGSVGMGRFWILDPCHLVITVTCDLGSHGPFAREGSMDVSGCFRDGKEGRAGEMGLHYSYSGKPKWHEGGSTGHVDSQPVAVPAGNVGGEHGHEPTASSCGPSGVEGRSR